MCYCFKAHLRCLNRLLWRSEDASLLFTVRSTTSLKRRSLFFTSSPNSPRSLELPLWQISGQPYPAVILGTQILNNRSGLLYPAGGAYENYENYENYESYESCCWGADGNNHPCGTSSLEPNHTAAKQTHGVYRDAPILSDKSDRSDRSDLSVTPTQHAYPRCHQAARHYPAVNRRQNPE